MNKEFVKKIHIIGSVGSGKTTLAKKLSSRLTIPHYELDNVVWKRCSTGDIKRTEYERDLLLSSIVANDQWIVEGVHHEWVSPSMLLADLIIFVDTAYHKRKYRIMKRYIRQIVKVEKANYKPTFAMLKKMFVWNADFERIHKQKIEELLKVYQEKVVILHNRSDEKLMIQQLKNHEYL